MLLSMRTVTERDALKTRALAGEELTDYELGYLVGCEDTERAIERCAPSVKPSVNYSANIPTVKLPTATACPRCGARMHFDDDPRDLGPYCLMCGYRPRTPMYTEIKRGSRTNSHAGMKL